MPKSLAVVMLIVVLAVGVDARSRRRGGGAAQSTAGSFDYYLLSLSWAPDFCDSNPGKGNSRECASGNHVGFIVHGLWPQLESGVRLKPCGSARPVATDIVNRMLPIMMDAGLVQHEWANHGTCSGLDPAGYFDTVRRAFSEVKIPDALNNLTQEADENAKDVESKFVAANPAFPRDAFRVTCANSEVAEVRICFTKDLKARSCTANEHDCPSPHLRMLPPR